MCLPDGLQLEVAVECESWKDKLPDYELAIKQSLLMIIQYLPEGRSLQNFPFLELSIVLCDDRLIHGLNRDYRGQDKPTNVLSFEGLTSDQRKSYLQSDHNVPELPFSLGEIYIAYETMIKEAAEAAISLKDHFFHLVIHGILHLLGYDHMTEDEANIMEAYETEILGHLGIDDPYAA